MIINTFSNLPFTAYSSMKIGKGSLTSTTDLISSQIKLQVFYTQPFTFRPHTTHL